VTRRFPYRVHSIEVRDMGSPQFGGRGAYARSAGTLLMDRRLKEFPLGVGQASDVVSDGEFGGMGSRSREP